MPSTIANGITIYLDLKGASVGTVDNLIQTINSGSTVESIAGISQVVAAVTGPIPGLGLVTNTVALTLAGVTSDPNGATVSQVISATGNVVAMVGGALAIAGVAVPALTVAGVALTVGGAAYNFYDMYQKLAPITSPASGGFGGGTGGGAGGTGGGSGGPGGGASGGPGSGGGGAGAGGTTPPRLDPLVLDLDGDGIETTSTQGGSVILFDHDADGVKTGTGWIKPDDGWLVLDRNGNGSIDTGRELFGVNTLKNNGQLATDGFDALKDLDANNDGKIDTADSVFANLRIWRDFNQDGISQTDELSTLTTNSITAIGVNATTVRTDLGNGNVQTAAGSFTRANGSVGGTGETNGAAANLDLLVNTFYRQFTDHILLTEQAKALPDLRGSGRVRDLSEAISLSIDLGNWVQTYTQQTSRQGQIDKLDGFIEKWADTADLKSLKGQAEALAGSGVTLTYALGGLAAGTPAFDEFVRKLGVVERFMGFTYGGANGQARLTPLDAGSGSVAVALSAAQIGSISLAYDRFQTDIYESLVPETRLNAYSKLLLEDSQNTPKFAALEAAFAQAIAASAKQGIVDLVEFISSVGQTRMAECGWASLTFLIKQLINNPNLGAFSEELSSWTVRFAGAAETGVTGTSRPDLIVGSAGADYIDGHDGADILLGGAGDDQILAGTGDDVLDGGAGNDLLAGDYANVFQGWYSGAGNDTYLFGRGDGQDTVYDLDGTVGNVNKLLFKAGVAPSDILLSRSGDSLVLKIAGTADQITLRSYLQNDGVTPWLIEQIAFADGTVWNLADVKAKLLVGTDANDNIVGYASADTITGGLGSDNLSGGGGNDTILGGADDDWLFGDDGGDLLQGGDGADNIQGGAGDDTMDGGAGSDILSGSSHNVFQGWYDGAGNDTYLFGRGDGMDTVYDLDGTVGNIDKIVFKAGVLPGQVQAVRNGDWLVLKIMGTSDQISVRDYFADNGASAWAIEEIRFTDDAAVVWNLASVNSALAAALIQVGTEGPDTLTGRDEAAAEQLRGMGGNDTLWANGSGDTLDGGAGDDVLGVAGSPNVGSTTFMGGAGNDTITGAYNSNTYIFNTGDGQDTVTSFGPYTGSADVLKFGAGIAADDVTPVRSGLDLVFRLGNGTDQVTVKNWFSDAGGYNQIEQVKFADGTTWTNAQASTWAQVNHAPTVVTGIGNQAATEDAAWTYVVPSNTFGDSDSGDVLAYSATKADGSALPAWLVFSATTRTFSGTPTNAEVGSLSLKVTATDVAGAAASSNFNVTVANTNDAPTVAAAVANQSATEDSAWSYVLPGTTFADVDAGDVLAYSATKADGSALPTWLAFNATTRTFSGTPSNAEVGSLSLKVTATDVAGAAASSTFNVTVANTNDAPTVAAALSNQGATKGTAWSYVVPANTFTDVDVGDVLTLSATKADGSALPAWLAFNPTNKTFSGTPLLADVGSLSLRVVATDTGGTTASSSFVVAIANTNVAPVLAVPLANQTSAEDQVFSFVVSLTTFTDADAGDVLTYSATKADDSALPTWLVFNATTRTFSGTPTNAEVGSLSLKVTATDVAGAAASSNFNVTVSNTNDAPTVASALANQSATKGTPWSYGVPANTFADVDVGDVLTLSATKADGSALPAWLAFNATTKTFSGTPLLADVGSLSLKVTATDSAGAKISSSFSVAVANANAAPVLAVPLVNQQGVETQAFSYAVPAGTFTDVDAGDVLTLSATLSGGAALPSWLTFNATTRTFSGTPSSTSSGILALQVKATDTSGAVATASFSLDIANIVNGTTGADTLTGTAARDVIYGLAGNDTINAGAGADTMLGGAGNDIYAVDDVGDVVTELANEGTDLVNAAISYTLGANVENLTLTGTANINATGNALANGLTGNAGNNILDGAAGADAMAGSAGNDTYYVDNVGDTTTEAASAGTDTVMSAINWTLAVNLENLTLIGTSAINGTGNTLANILTGNSAANTLDGGTGADTLAGGAGDDIYLVDHTGDVVTELAAEGTDLVNASVNYTLGANVENLTLTGTSAINATGNALDNVLTGNSAANVLTGGAGNDTYIAGTGDTTIEAANAGTDTVQTAIAWTLATNVENLLLTGTSAVNGTGNASDNILTGNSAANTLTGNAGADTLDGKAGADTLIGGTGNDTYWLGRGWGIDTIQENDATAGNTDVAQFDVGIATDQLWFQHVANNLEVSIIGTSDKFTLANWYSGSANHVEQFKTSNGKMLLDSQVQNLVSAMAAFSPPAAGQTTLSASYATTLAPVIAANWV